MKIIGASLEQFAAVVKKVSNKTYDGNVIVEQNAHDDGHQRCTARLKVADSRGTGARRSVSGRRQPAACWHAYRDVIHEFFVQYPEGRISTGMEKYDGMTGFLRNYPATADKNIGSQFQPAFMPDLCECGDSIVWPSWI